MNQLQAHGQLFAEVGMDHRLAGERYAAQIDDLVARLERRLPLDVGHDFDVAHTREGLIGLLTELHPFTVAGAREVATQIRQDLWQLAYGDEGTTGGMGPGASA